MVEEAEALWEAVASQTYEFDARQREVEELQTISLQDVQVWVWSEGGGWATSPRLGAQGIHSDIDRAAPSPGPFRRMPSPLLADHLRLAQEFYATHIAPARADTLRELSVHVVGKAHLPELDLPAPEGVELLPDPARLHERLSMHSWHAGACGQPRCEGAAPSAGAASAEESGPKRRRTRQRA